MERSFPARPESLSAVRAFIDGMARRVQAQSGGRRDLVLAVSEACANAITHTASRDIHVSCRIVLDALNVSVRDEGAFVWGARPDGGWGIPLMRTLSDSLTIRAGTAERLGTTVILVKNIRPWRERLAVRRSQARHNRLQIRFNEGFCSATRDRARRWRPISFVSGQLGPALPNRP